MDIQCIIEEIQAEILPEFGKGLVADYIPALSLIPGDKLNGYAITYYADGSISQEGIFKDDEFLYAQKESEKRKIDKHKEFCEEIGFTPKTEGFTNCVLELMKKD